MYENNANYGHSADVIYPPRFQTDRARLGGLINSRMPRQQAARVMDLLSKTRECMAGMADACEYQAGRIATQGENMDVSRIYADLLTMASCCRQGEDSLGVAINAMFPLNRALGEVSAYVPTDQPFA